jgi:hypothetical protein
MNFKPTLWKSIVSIAFVLVIVIYGNMVLCSICPLGVQRCGGLYRSLMLIKSCVCDCISFETMFLSNLINVVLPFALIYIIWSLIQKKKEIISNKISKPKKKVKKK